MVHRSNPAHNDTHDARAPWQLAPPMQLRLAKMGLLGFLIATALIGNRVAGWPVMTWNMYARSRTPFPPSSWSAVELRVTTANNRDRRITPAELFQVDRREIGERAFEFAFDDSDVVRRDVHRDYLTGVVGRFLRDGTVQSIEGWSLEWRVQPLELPPLRLDAPDREVRLGSFSPRDAARKYP